MPFMYRKRYADTCGWWVKSNAFVDEDRDISITNALMNRGEKGLLATIVSCLLTQRRSPKLR